MRKCKIIGLTGQSGAGKSTAAQFLKEEGFCIVNADAIVHKLYVENQACKIAVCAAFGADLVKESGEINRALLGKRVFSSAEKIALLGSIVHPFVTAELFKEIKTAAEQGFETVVYDAPQLFESNADVICDFTAGVTASKSIRVKRICKRDNISEELALARINSQLDEEVFRERCDLIIENSGTQLELETQIKELVSKLKAR